MSQASGSHCQQICSSSTDRTVERPSVEAVIAEDQEEMWDCSSASRHVTSHLTPQSDQSQKYAVFFMRLTGSSKRKVIRQRYE